MSKESWSHELQGFESFFFKITKNQCELGLQKSGQYSAIEWAGFLFLGGIIHGLSAERPINYVCITSRLDLIILIGWPNASAYESKQKATFWLADERYCSLLLTTLFSVSCIFFVPARFTDGKDILQQSWLWRDYL